MRKLSCVRKCTPPHTPDLQDPNVAQIVLRTDQLAKLRKLAPDLRTDQELARRMNMDQGQVSRVLRGAAPGARFIAGILDVFGIEFFQDLFAVIPDDDGNGAAA